MDPTVDVIRHELKLKLQWVAKSADACEETSQATAAPFQTALYTRPKPPLPSSGPSLTSSKGCLAVCITREDLRDPREPSKRELFVGSKAGLTDTR
ncbi:MAG: hypothetical protein FRX49_03283 [Trebouxia sp. A1-2]|nr:MAG: hypothetical protein FRX49_03283 [Trebouxia sp. A1-2]